MAGSTSNMKGDSVYRFTIHSNVTGNTSCVTLVAEDSFCARCIIVGLSDGGIDSAIEIEEQIEVGDQVMWVPSSVDSVFLTIAKDSLLSDEGDDNA